VGQAAEGAWDGVRLRSRLLSSVFGEPIEQSTTTPAGSTPSSGAQNRLDLTSFEWMVLRDPPRTYWLDVAWPLFGKYLMDIRATAAEASAPVLVVAIPQMSQFDDATRARSMAEFRFTEDEVDWDRPQRMLMDQANRAGLAVLDLLPIFRARADRAQLDMRIDTHFSRLGHQVVADALAETLVQGEWIHH
jgi:hypothetical protein